MARQKHTAKFKLSKKHLAIFAAIEEKGGYKPTYSDQEPATQNLLSRGIIEWREDYKCLVLTQTGKDFVRSIYNTENNRNSDRNPLLPNTNH